MPGAVPGAVPRVVRRATASSAHAGGGPEDPSRRAVKAGAATPGFLQLARRFCCHTCCVGRHSYTRRVLARARLRNICFQPFPPRRSPPPASRSPQHFLPFARVAAAAAAACRPALPSSSPRRRFLTTIERIKTMPFPLAPSGSRRRTRTVTRPPLCHCCSCVIFPAGVFVRGLGVRGAEGIRAQSRFERTLRCRRGEGGKYPRWRAVPH